MSLDTAGYLEGTRHPWTCLLFILPLLLAYEGGRSAAAQSPVQVVRNGAEHWLHQGLDQVGFPHDYSAPVLLIGVLLVWSVVRRQDRPRKLINLGIGMVIESGLFAVGLYVLGHLAILPVFDRLGVLLETSKGSSIVAFDPTVEQALRYLGAGIYEETMFRLGLFTALCWLFHLADFSTPLSTNLAAITSAILFSGAHHLEASAEPFHAAVFLYRTLAGYYFAWIYQLRGIGIAVGAHAFYDVLVGLLVPNL